MSAVGALELDHRHKPLAVYSRAQLTWRTTEVGYCDGENERTAIYPRPVKTEDINSW